MPSPIVENKVLGKEVAANQAWNLLHVRRAIWRVHRRLFLALAANYLHTQFTKAGFPCWPQRSPTCPGGNWVAIRQDGATQVFSVGIPTATKEIKSPIYNAFWIGE